MVERPTADPHDLQALRRQAERAASERVRERGLPPPERLPELVHELQVHQIELEMQNEALRQAQTALESSRDRYADLYDFAPVGYVTLDEQGIVREINLTASGMLGRARSSLAGRRFTLCVAQRERGRFRDYLQRCRGAASGTASAIELVIPAQEHGERFVSLRTVVAVDPQTGERQYRVAITDITDQKRAEEALARLNESLERQVAERTATARQRARDLRRMAAELNEVEHRERRRMAKLLHDDLQQLLLAIKMRLAVLTEDHTEKRKQQLEGLDALVDECLNTSRDLSRELSPPVLEHGSLSEVLTWLGAWFGDKYGLTVVVEAPEKSPGTEEHLRVFLFQAVRELLLNVVKHSGKMAARLRLSFRRGELVIEVEDEGERFDPEALKSRLQQLEGFGLFNIQERLEAVGGRLEIEKTPRGGACFRMIAPMAEDAESERIETLSSRARAPRAAGSTIRLLVAEDHQVVREGLVGLLKGQKDFEVVGEAANGEQALQQAEVLQPDAILMDVDMPVVNGIEATRKIKRRWSNVVVVGLSFHEEGAVWRAMAEAGADAYVTKESPGEELVEVVRRLCR